MTGFAAGAQIDPNTALIGRIWRPHPRYSNDADSSMRALRAECEELLLLDRMIRSAARSRLSAGILFIPDTLSIATRSPVSPLDVADEPEDTFESELMAAMTQPIADEMDASSVVPMLIRGPADLGDKIRHTLLGRDVSATLMERSQAVMERLLQGLDVPKEIVQGLQDIKYSNALVINDGMYKATIEPMAVLLSDALTEIILRPMLRAKGWDDADVGRITVWYDPSEIVSKPDPAESATAGFDRYLLSGDAWRQAHGFSDADAPRSGELARRVALEKTSVSPEVAQVLLEKLFPDLLNAERAQNVASDGGMPAELGQALSGEPLPGPTGPLDGKTMATAPDINPMEQLAPPEPPPGGGGQL
jgi:hypothetical protein